MADQFYISPDYFTPDGYFTYVADAISGQNSNFLLAGDGDVLGAPQEGAADLSAIASVSAAATISRDFESTQTSQGTVTVTGGLLQFVSADIGSLFTPTLTVELFKNSFSVMDVVANFAAQAQANKPARATLPSGIAQTFVVTVINDGVANIFVIDGVNKPVLTLQRGSVYTFDQSDYTNVSHQLAFKDSAGNSYTSGVVTTGEPGYAGAQTVYSVPFDAPDDLRYYCVTHGNYMGNTITVTGGSVMAVTARADFLAQSVLNSTANIAFQSTVNKPAQSTMLASANALARGFLRFERPLQISSAPTGFGQFSTDIKKFGSHSFNASSNKIEYHCSGKVIPTPFTSNDRKNWGIEFWVYPQSTQVFSTIVNYVDQTTTYWSIRFRTDNRIDLNYIDGNDISRNLQTSLGMTLDDWHHVAVTLNDLTISIFIDGSRLATVGATTFKQNTSNQGTLKIGGTVGTTWGGHLDEFRIVAGSTSDVITAIGDSTFGSLTVPTDRRFNNNEYTQYLAHYDNNYEDDVSEIKVAASNLSVQVAVSATLSGTQKATAAVSALSTISAQTLRLKDLSATTNSESTVVADSDRFRLSQAQASSESTLDVTVSKIAGINADLQCETEQNIEYIRQRDVSISTDSIATQLIAAAKVGDFLLTLESAAAISIDAVKTADAVSTPGAETQLTIEGTVSIEAIAPLSVNILFFASPFKFFGIISNQTASTELLAAAGAIQQASSALVTESTLTAEANQFTGISGTLAAQASISTDTDRLRDFNIVVSADAGAVVEATVIRSAQSAVEAVCQQQIDYIRNRNVEIATDSIATQLSAAAKVGDFLITLESSAQIQADISVKTGTLLELQSTATSLSTAAKITDIVSNQTAVTDLQVLSDSTISYSATMSMIANQQAQAEIFTVTSAVLGADTALSIVLNRFRETGYIISSVTLLDSLVSRIRSIDTSLTAQAAANIVAGILASGDAQLVALYSQLTQGFVIHLTEELTFKIQKEIREWQVRAESRIHIIRG